MNCDVCNYAIDGLYYTDAYGKKGHQHHEFCDCCTGFIIGKPHHQTDGRKNCTICQSNSVNDRLSGREARSQVYELFKKVGISFPENDITLIVNDKTFAVEKWNSRNFYGRLITNYKQSLIGTTTKYTIYILSGLHKVIFNSVLAHELMHVWQHEHTIELSELENEGLCELVCYYILDASQTRIGKVAMKQMEKSKDPIYGDGFRLMKSRFEKVGNWNTFLKGL
jgi:hypothetical protein